MSDWNGAPVSAEGWPEDNASATTVDAGWSIESKDAENSRRHSEEDQQGDSKPDNFVDSFESVPIDLEAEASHDNKCFGCGEEGHRRADCPKAEPSVCHYCKKPDHMLKDCPEKPAMLCDNCGEEGHLRKTCQNARKIDRDHIVDMPADQAWEKIKAAALEKDVDDVKEAIQEYVKAVAGQVTYRELQESFISENINVWMIATERSLIDIFTNMDIQGKTGKRYTVSYRFSDQPARPRERDGWPQSREELLSRLDDAGDTVDSGIPKCLNCKELGHVAKYCSQEKLERTDLPKTSCYNCGADGHRVRDCPDPRVDKFACKNCGKSGHKAADCEELPDLSNVECRKCNETGHFAKDCPQGGGDRGCRNCGVEGHLARDCDQPENLDNVTCRNCEKTGHRRRDCPEPTNWSKVQCNNCQQYGHTRVRCPEPPAEVPVETMQFENDIGTSTNSQGSGMWSGGNANAVAIAVDSFGW